MTAATTPAPPLLAEVPFERWRNRRALLAGILIFSLMSLWMGTASKGFLEADACTHYMEARHSIEEPAKLTGVWGRPLCTGSYAIPAYLGGVMGVRVMSLLMAVVSGLVTYRIARVQGFRWPALAAILLFAQPLFYMHSFSELTEIPFALVAILAFWAYQSRQYLAMTILVAITPSGRPEGFFLIALAGLALMCHRRWYYLVLLPVPLLIWSYCGWITFGRPADMPWYTWLKRNWPYAAESAYGRGHWLHFVVLLPALVSPLVTWALFPGVVLALRGRTGGTAPAPLNERGIVRRFFADHRARCQVMIAVIPLTILLVHTVLWRFGKMASNGELRYLLCVAPLWALLCAQGWEWAWVRLRIRTGAFLAAGIAAAGPVVANRFYTVVPLRLYNEDYVSMAAAAWYRDTPGLAADYPLIMASPTKVFYELDRSSSNSKVSAGWGKENVEKVPPGVALFWDDVYGLTNSNRDLIVPREAIERAGWVGVGTVTYQDKTIYLYLSTKTAGGTATDPKRYPAPGDVTPDWLGLGRFFGELTGKVQTTGASGKPDR